MKILLLHPDDSPLAGSWVEQKWDAVYDLARSGWAACERWSRIFGCTVKPIDGLRDGYAEIRKVRELLQYGFGRLVDREGLDWWELTSIFVHQPLENVILLRKFAEQVAPLAEVWITRDGIEAAALRQWLGTQVRVIAPLAKTGRKGPRHYLNRLRRLPGAQGLQILGDKYDAGYRVRRHFHARVSGSDEPVVLIPSSYVNMSLTGTGYARLAPDKRFLMVSTRQSGRLPDVPDNVKQGWLAAYAGDPSWEEYREIIDRWTFLKREIEGVPELGVLLQAGLMGGFPKRFADGLAIRNAWLGVLNVEPVEAVLCCDDSNPHTHIPLLLAKQRGLPTIACHHGAFDGRHLFKRNHADIILAKGEMEQDYLVETCGLDPSVVEIGAPNAIERANVAHKSEGDWIVFFSEPYEMTAGRTEEIYRDVIPGLSDLAKMSGKTLVVKLHPSENLKDRQSLMRRVVTREQAGAIHWRTGRFGPELLERTWFGLTVQSSVAMDCLIHGAPCFLCDWLDLWPYGYIRQYRKFGVGIGLHTPQDIATIPERLAAYTSDSDVVVDCSETMSPQ
ncbi:MAG: hypothetical protein DMG80_03935 [Acidobacteria bacterium]|nr:MAG: hypothetical protein DMG80_03935 [Acidobacteriota bacterium]